MEELKYWVWLSTLLNVIPRKKHMLMRDYGDPANLWEAEESDLRGREYVTDEVLRDITDREKRQGVDGILERLYREDIGAVRYIDPSYPELLKQIFDPPLLLYKKGRIESERLRMAVVGSRNATSYGLNASYVISESLARLGFTVVSGMARGIDSMAHRGALKSGGRTIAVLGCGLDIPYPTENGELMKAIAGNGAAISEYPPGTAPLPRNFPARNRIISGLSKGVVVIEASERSGSLITARFALEQGREVFALPGNVGCINSVGTNRLIRDGARILTSMEDILEELNITYNKKNPQAAMVALKPKRTYVGLDGQEKSIVELLRKEELQIDLISSKSGLDISKVSSTLVMLELKGIVEQLPGKYFRLR